MGGTFKFGQAQSTVKFSSSMLEGRRAAEPRNIFRMFICMWNGGARAGSTLLRFADCISAVHCLHLDGGLY